MIHFCENPTCELYNTPWYDGMKNYTRVLIEVKLIDGLCECTDELRTRIFKYGRYYCDKCGEDK